jgi:hypothetical protein
MGSPYYQSGCPRTCAGCGHPFREYDGQKIAVHVHGLGYFCCAEHAEAARQRVQAEAHLAAAS